MDLAALSAVTGEVAIRLANATETYDLTGYSTGGTPPFGYGRDVRVFMDQDLCGYPWVWAAAGTATAVFRISPRTLRMLSNAFVVPLAVGPWIAPSRPTEVKPRFRPETSRGPLPAPARPTGQHPSSGEPLPPSWQRALLRDLDLELV